MIEEEEIQPIESYGEIGTLLKAAREEVRIPIDQAAHMLHIRVRYLEALEHGRLHELPGLTYTRGYLQAYAVFLGLDKGEILRRFEQVENELARRNFYFPQVFSKEKTPNRWAIWGGLAAALLVYAAWALVLKAPSHPISMVEKHPEPPKVHITAELAGKVPCLQELEEIYPPCTTQPERFTLLPLSNFHVSFMDMNPPAADANSETDADADTDTTADTEPPLEQ